MISFTVYGEPVAQGRARLTTVNGRAWAYDPQKSRDWKDYVKLAAAQYAPKVLIEGAIELEVTVYRPMPKSISGSRKKAERAEKGELRPITKPDTDNYIKGVKDALKGVIWKDDSQVTDEWTRKRYSARPRVEIRIVEVTTE